MRRAFSWIVLGPLLAALLLLVAGPAPIWAGFLALVIPVAFWTDKANGLGWADRLWRTALLALWVPLGVLGFLAPARALLVWGLRPFEGMRWARELSQAPPFILDVPLFNGMFGLCGTAFAFYGGQRSLRLLRHIRQQLERLPRAKAASAAMGLAELSGVARRVEDPELRAEQRACPPAWAPGLPLPEDDALLWKAELAAGENLRYELRQRFYLEDASGRILVDAGPVAFKDQAGGFLMDNLQGLVLGRGKRVLPGPQGGQIEVLSLREGQELYAIGTVQPREGAPGGKVLAPDPQPMEQGLFARLFPTSHMAKAGGDPAHANSLFLVSDARESLTRLAVQRSTRNTLWVALAWLALSTGLAVSELQRIGPGAWPPERLMPRAPAPQPLPTPTPAPILAVDAGPTHYMALWRKGKDVLGSDNGAWSLGGAERVLKTALELKPRALLLLGPAEGEPRLRAALDGAGVAYTLIERRVYEDWCRERGRDPESYWSLPDFAEDWERTERDAGR